METARLRRCVTPTQRASNADSQSTERRGVRCGPLCRVRRRDSLCIPAGGGSPEGHFRRREAVTGSLVRRLNLRLGQRVDSG